MQKQTKLQSITLSLPYLLFETLFLILIPLYIIVKRPELLAYRNYIMFAALAYIYFFCHLHKLGLQNLGLGRKNFLISLKKLLLPTSLTLLAMWLVWSKFPGLFYLEESARTITNNGITAVALKAVFISVPLQEIIFRGFYLSRLQMVFKNQHQVSIYATLIFAIIHIPFASVPMVLFTFAVGLWWNLHFMKYRNVYSLMLSHATVNLLDTFLIYFSL